MKEIPLTQGYVTIVDDEDFGWLSQWKWYWNKGYAERNERQGKKRIKVRMHRLVLAVPMDREVDHINGDGLDNRRSNLRVCTTAQNRRNRKKSKHGLSSRYKGVCWYKSRKKWGAQISLHNKIVYLGLYEDEEEAARAYNMAALLLHRNFARLNEIPAPSPMTRLAELNSCLVIGAPGAGNVNRMFLSNIETKK